MNKGTVATEKHCVPTTFTEDEVLKNQGGFNSQKNWVGVCGLLPKTLTLFTFSMNSTSILIQMLQSDWLSYSYTTCISI